MSALPFDHTSMCVPLDDVLVLGGGATGALSSSDHSDIAALCIRAVRLPPNEMSAGSWGATSTVLLFFWAGSFSAKLSSIPGGTPLLTSTFASVFGRGADGTFVRLSGRPSIHCLWPFAPRHTREVHRLFLPINFSTSELFHCSAPARDKKH